jgi:hypothetical protein
MIATVAPDSFNAGNGPDDTIERACFSVVPAKISPAAPPLVSGRPESPHERHNDDHERS